MPSKAAAAGATDETEELLVLNVTANGVTSKLWRAPARALDSVTVLSWTTESEELTCQSNPNCDLSSSFRGAKAKPRVVSWQGLMPAP